MFKTKHQIFVRHVEILYFGLKQHKYEVCNEKLKDAERLTFHVQMKHTKEPFRCKHCSFTSMSNNAVKRHRAKVHAPTSNPPDLNRRKICLHVLHGVLIQLKLSAILKPP